MTRLYNPGINVIPLDDSIKQLSSSFSCGNIFIDNFFRSAAASDPGIGRTYVWLGHRQHEIIGFYNLAAGSLEYFSSDSSFKMGGAVHINEFALAEKYHGSYIGIGSFKMSDVLMIECLKHIEAIRRDIGFSFATLHSTSEGFNLYRRHDFEVIEEDMGLLPAEGKERDCIPMYLSLDLEG